MLGDHSQNLFFIFRQSAKWHELSDRETFSTRMHFGHWGKLRTTTPAQSPHSWCIWQITVVSRSLNTSRFPQHMLDMLDMRSYLIGWRTADYCDVCRNHCCQPAGTIAWNRASIVKSCCQSPHRHRYIIWLLFSSLQYGILWAFMAVPSFFESAVLLF